jgi:5-methylcytosine-specific restriction protein A
MKMPALILKVNPRQILDGPFRPKKTEDWAKARFHPPRPNLFNGKIASVGSFPAGSPVYVWTHIDARLDSNLAGEGIKARGTLRSVRAMDGGKVEVEIDNIEFLSPPLGRDKVTKVASECAVFAELLKNTTSRSLWLDDEQQADFEKGVDLAEARYLEMVSEVSGKAVSGLAIEVDSEQAWSDDELKEALSGYLEILGKEQSGGMTNKAEANRQLRANGLSGRTAASLEYRMQNFSAFFKSRNLPTIEGYKPAGNIGKNVEARLERILAELGRPEVYAPTADQETLKLHVNELLKSPDLPIPIGTQNPEVRQRSSNSFVRSPAVVAYVLQQADGLCEACAVTAPFSREDGTPFLEVHHVRPLSANGPDTVDNVVAICPNCHRGFHHAADRNERVSKLLLMIERLRDHR